MENAEKIEKVQKAKQTAIQKKIIIHSKWSPLSPYPRHALWTGQGAVTRFADGSFRFRIHGHRRLDFSINFSQSLNKYKKLQQST
jgi:hypothetical protein